MMRPVVALTALLTVAASAHADDGIPVGTLIYDVVPGEVEAVELPLPEVASEPVFDPVTVHSEPAPALIAETVPIEAVPVQQSQASVRSGEPVAILPAGEVAPGQIVPQVDLAPGETVVQMIASPSAIVRIPSAQPVVLPVTAPAPVQAQKHQPVVDPVTGRLRDTPGWTGNTAAPVGVGCFPAGSCASIGN